MPTASDLVTDLPADFETFGQAVATSMADLLGGTTGQVLSKASNTDMDFTWVAQDDSNAIQNAIVDAKGDLIAASAADTPARLAVGANGETLVADSSTSTGLRYQSNFAAGKNKIINGDFGVWQRGTSFSNPSSGAYTADRYFLQHDGTGATRTISQQTFTPGTAPVAGYEGTYYFRYAISAAGTGNTYNVIKQAIEDVRVYAGQTVTMSVWLKADSARSVVLNLNQYFGSGGSSEVVGASTTASVTTSWQRFTYTATLGSMSGKTIGTGSYLTFTLQLPTNTTQTIEIWGAQVEASNTPTAFQTATGTIQGELAACQRYFSRFISGASKAGAMATASSTTAAFFAIPLIVEMRSAPSLTVSAASHFGYSGVANTTVITLNATQTTSKVALVDGTIATASLVTRSGYLFVSDSASATFDLSAEL